MKSPRKSMPWHLEKMTLDPLEKVNKALDEIVESPKYQELVEKYIIEK